MKKLLLLLLLILSINISFAQANYVAMLVTDENGNYLEGENVNLVHPLASITKMITVMIAMDKVEKGEISYEDKVYISYKASTIGGSSSSLRYKEKVKLEDLMKATIVRSGNDAAFAIAEYIAGSEEEFANLMNQKAQDLGLKDTKFYTATGLPTNMTNKKLDVSTVSDIAKLSAEIIRYPKYMEWSGKKSITIKETVTFRNRNNLIGKYQGLDGLKTGHHSKAEYNVTLTAKRDDLRLILVIFGSPNETIRDDEAVKIFDRAFEKYEKIKIASKGEFALKLKIKDAKNKKIDLVVKDDVYAIVDKDAKWKFYKTAYVPEVLTAPIGAEEKVGVLNIEYRGRKINEVTLIPKEEVKKASVIRKIFRALTFNLI